MGARVLIFVVVLAVILQYLHAAPSPNAKPMELSSKEQRQLIDSFAQFLEADSEQLHALAENHLGSNRDKRQSGGDADPENFDDAPKPPGFFDRAAKFVTELLQKFLKWINSSEDN